MLFIDILIPTYNGGFRIGRTLESLLGMLPVENLDWRVTVIDNNSTDDTRDIVNGYIRRFDGRLQYIFEKQQGRGCALNRGLSATRGDVVAMVDDDETVAAEWLGVIASTFRENPDVDFAGGPYIPVWPDNMAPPAWLPPDRAGVLGNTYDPEIGLRPLRFGAEYKGVLMGGNAAIRRQAFGRVGYYSVHLGRTHKRLLSCEDDDLQERLLSGGLNGLFVPAMRIYHWIPRTRITKPYFRRWSLWHAYSKAIMDAMHPKRVATVFGVPRWMVGAAVWRTGSFLKGPAERFSAELLWWDLAGYALACFIERRTISRLSAAVQIQSRHQEINSPRTTVAFGNDRR